jgi:hypothetical protein
MNNNPKLVLFLALVLFVSTVIFAAEPEEFNADQIQKIWPELWKQGAQEVKAPEVDPLSEQQVIKEMSGRWTAQNGPDKICIVVETNRQAAISGIKDGTAWEKSGQWKVISNKLILFLKGDELPVFVFRIKGDTDMYDPWADTLMSEMKRENEPAAQLKTSAPDQQFPSQPVLPVNGRIYKTNILAILESIDRGSLNKDAAVVVANFAANAVISATVVEGSRTDTRTDGTSDYRNNLEAGFKSFDDYKLQRKYVTVEISPDGRKAGSVSTLVETYHFAGNAERAVTEETDTFEIIDGKVLLTKMDSKVKVTIE